MAIQNATLHQMKIFDTLVRHMNVARTAEAMHMTPPAVSIQVKQLSESVGQPLLEQVGKKLFLTETGNIVATACRDLFDRLERVSQDLAMNEGLQKGRLRLSIITTAQYFIPHLLSDFGAKHPGIDVSLLVGNRQVILDRLARNRDDLYILGQPPDNIKVKALPFASNPLVAIAYPNHPLVGKQKAIAPERLGEEAFIAREEGSGTRLAYEDFFRRNKTAPKIRMELGSNEAVTQAVVGRLGISILSQSTVRAEVASGEIALLNVRGLPLERQWYVVHLEKKHRTPASMAFEAFLLAQHVQTQQD